MSDTPETETLGDQLPKEIERCQRLVAAYDSIGTAGQFGAAVIRYEIRNAHEAMMSGDLPAMIEAYKRLQGCS